MGPYLYFSFIVSLLLIGTLFNREHVELLSTLQLIVIVLFVGLRHEVGFDYEAYRNPYELNQIKEIVDIFSLNQHFETGFSLFQNLLNFGRIPFNINLLIIALISIGAKQFAIRKLTFQNLIPIYFYLAYFVLDFEMGIIRQSLALGVSLVGYSFYLSDKKKVGIIILVFAVMFHKSLFLFLFLPLISDKKMTKEEFVIILSVSFIFLLLDLNYYFVELVKLIGETLPSSNFSNKIISYSELKRYSYKVKFKWGFVSLLMFAFCGFYYSNKINALNFNRFFRTFMIGGLMGTYTFSNFAVLTRFSLNFYIFFGLCLGQIYNVLSTRLKYILIILLIIFFHMKIIINVHRAKSTYIPYDFFFLKNYR
jgi:hypothetical protein